MKKRIILENRDGLPLQTKVNIETSNTTDTDILGYYKWQSLSDLLVLLSFISNK